MMTAKKLTKQDREIYLRLLKQFGEVGLFQKVIGTQMVRSADVLNVDIETLNLSELFLAQFRTTGDEKYALISKILRRAAHVIYRQLQKKTKKKPNSRFLHQVN